MSLQLQVPVQPGAALTLPQDGRAREGALVVPEEALRAADQMLEERRRSPVWTAPGDASILAPLVARAPAFAVACGS